MPHIQADGLAIRRLVTNLLGNAIRYTPPEGKISVSVQESQGKILIDVADTGEGMSVLEQRQLFQRFQQGTSGVGTGLGLYLCRQIVEAHKGTISCDSELSKGSKFSVELPVAQSAPS